MDFEAARLHMVASQVRPNKVTDPRILEAMRRIPRERFVPPNVLALAYADEDVPLGGGRYLTEPMVIARLVQAAAIVSGDRALVVAAGPGYSAALLAACGAQVTALEEDAGLAAQAGALLPAVAPSVTVVTGPLAAGWKPAAPYDVVLIDGAAEEIPQALIDQVKPERGRIVAVRAFPGGVSHAAAGEIVATAGSARVAWQPLFDCATPVLPAFRLAPSFVF
jgi:protein-L-isoaspartate(D-aspartate) O-methyltransferase